MRFAARLLLFVALLLPFRGAMAVVGGWCHSGHGGPAKATVAAPHADHGHAGEHDHDHGAHPAPLGGEPAPESGTAGAAAMDEHGSSTSSCTFCSAVCAAPPLPSGPVAVHALLPTGAERFPALPLARSSAAFGAPERPPRSA